jgi:hypothetical protein
MARDDVAALRGLYASFNSRDADGMSGVMDPAIEIDPTEDLAYAAALLKVLGPRFVILSAGYQGIEEVMGLFRTVWQISEWFEVAPSEFIQMGHLVVVPLLLRARSREDGREGEAETAHLWTMGDGRAQRLRVFPSREAAVAEAAGELKGTD